VRGGFFLKKMIKKGTLQLQNGLKFEGTSFGADTSSSGEVVFNTGMVGYPETFTDPSYYGQILVLTYPLVGSYGVPKDGLESEKIQIKGLIVQNYIENPSHFTSVQTLGSWLKKENVPALFGVDTRAITEMLRHKGVMLGSLRISGEKPQNYDPNSENVLPFVSCEKLERFGEGKKHIVLVDCGAKDNILRSFLKRKVSVSVVPWNFDFKTLHGNFDGVMISNGPGDPTQAKETIKQIAGLMDEGVPTFGICLGSQLLALAAGGKTYKLKFGHRSQNQPVMDKMTGKAIITSQNHGFAVDAKSLPKDFREWFVNLNDFSNEGIRHKSKPFLAAQFHPEATPGPTDADYLFDEFLRYV
jgi:carbamoyl-phosphate synthase small subunit